MRTRAQHATNAQENMHAPHNAKRQALESSNAAQPQPKRAALGDVTNAISNVKLGSVKKTVAGTVGALTRQRGHAVLPKASAAPLARITELNTKPPVQKRSSRTVRTVPAQAANTSSRSASAEADFPHSDPAPHYDYDAGLLSDPTCVPQYAMDIFRYHRCRENKFKVRDYMGWQRELTPAVRGTLMDWLIETQENFELNHETLYQSVKLTDMYFSRTPNMPCEEVQLVGAAAMFIASKFDERQPPPADDFLFICDDAYTRDEMLAMERRLLDVVDFDVGMPLSYRFLRRYSKATGASIEILTLARYILELSLVDYQFVVASESQLSAAAFWLASAMQAKHVTGKAVFEWTNVLQKYTDMVKPEFAAWIPKLNQLLIDAPESKLSTVYNKYSHKVFLSVARKFSPLTTSEAV